MTGMPHVESAWQYAQDVVAGDVVSCRLMVNAAQRFLDDLERDDFGFHLDAGEAERACEFIERLPGKSLQRISCRGNMRQDRSGRPGRRMV